MDKKNNLNIYLKPLFAVIVWGISFIATKYVLAELNPTAIVFVRQLLGIGTLLIIIFYQKESLKITFQSFKWILVLSLTACFHLWIQITGLQFTSASNTGWIIGITPVFMVLLAFIFYKEKLTKQQLVGITISFLGLLLLVSKGNISSLDLVKNKGDLLIISSSFTWSLYSMASKKATLSSSPVITTFYLFLFVALLISPFTLNRQNLDSIITLSLQSWMWLLFLGVLCSGVAYALWARALQQMDTSRVGAFLYIEPFVTFIGAWFILNEQLTVITFVSGLIIIGGVIVVNRNK